MKEFKQDQLNFSDKKVRKEFIKNTESGLYAGKDFDGKQVIVGVEQGVGMSVKSLNSKGWYEGLEYDEDGNVTDEILMKA